MSTIVHPTAVVEDGAQLGVDVYVGPYCFVAASAYVGDRCHLDSFVRVHQNTRLGSDNRVQAFCSLGGDAEDLKFQGETCFLEIGDHNDFREHVTINRGTKGGGSVTRVGNSNLFQNKVHVGHDCLIGDGVILSATSAMAGHVELEDNCIIGGGSLIHQFCRVGTGTMIGFGSMLGKSVPPYCLFNGASGLVEGANIVGLRRRGVENSIVAAISQAINILYSKEDTLQYRAQSILSSDLNLIAEVANIVDFVQNRLGKRGLADGAI